MRSDLGLVWLNLFNAQLSPKNDSCIKKGGDESHFSVSVIVRDKVKR